ncbi:MAG TPA: Hsp20/alpha crystallin family protein [Mycobacterium sp.]|nr:Hsp20/alpha crystallin family protein [Mycobacterium sp.]
MSALPARDERRLWADVFDWFSGWPFWGRIGGTVDSQVMPLEDEMIDGRYEIRAQIPGVDPVRDIEITVHGGFLTIRAERAEKAESKRRSEFPYGSFARTVPLPAGADDDDIKATYDKGILTVSVGMSQPNPVQRHIEVHASPANN